MQSLQCMYTLSSLLYGVAVSLRHRTQRTYLTVRRLNDQTTTLNPQSYITHKLGTAVTTTIYISRAQQKHKHNCSTSERVVVASDVSEGTAKTSKSQYSHWRELSS
ncbi:unnamed protein product, partial [Ectocarpus sp. 13 AM-2016]